jgi:glycosyltransferase involved in cell wall biosynthesis
VASNRTGRPPEILAAGASRGGVGDVFQRVVLELRERGHEVDVVPLARGRTTAIPAVCAAYRARRSIRGARTVHVEFGSNDVEAFWFGLAAVLLRRDCVIVAHDYPKLAHVPSAGLVPTRWRRLNAIAHRIIAPALDPVLTRLLVRRAGVLCVFGAEAQQALRAEGAAAVQVVPHGSDPTGGAVPASRGQTVLFAGFLGPHKGLDVLLEAWARAHDHVELPLVIAGGADPFHSGWTSALERRFATLANPPRFLGAVPDEDDFQELFDHAAIVVLPYRYSSPASGVLTRAMAAARPVITTRVPAACATIIDGENGRLVPIDDAEALAEAIVALYRSPEERDRLGESAAQTMLQRFSWDQHLEGLERAYETAHRR